MAAGHVSSPQDLSNMVTSHIIYHEEDGNGNVMPRFLNLGPEYPSQTLVITPPNMHICSSSNGIILAHDAMNTNYYLLNPFVYNTIKPLPAYLRPPTHYMSGFTIVAVNQSTVDVVFLMGPYDNGSFYVADVFCSDTDCWYTMNIAGDFSTSCILENTGVSCGRNVFFISNAGSVLKIDIVNSAYIFIPLPYHDDISRVQLGREGGLLCAVMVNEGKGMIEAHWLEEQLDEEKGHVEYILMAHCMVHVVLMEEHECDGVSFFHDETTGIMGIKCRGMPKPVRFESFRTQVPLWVDCKIVMLETAFDGNSVLRVVEQCRNLPSCVSWGMAHVMCDTRLFFRIRSPY